MIKTITQLTAISILLSSCSTGEKVGEWHITNLYDEFTESKTCRVEKNSAENRSFLRGFTGQYFTYHFYAENKDGEVRAGIRSEPLIPISGDVQIKIGEKLITLTSADAPLDSTPATPQITGVSKDIAKMTEDITKTTYKMASPYRAYTGDKAKKLLRDITNYNGEVKFRTVGINTATSGTGRFTPDETLKTALKRCDINL
jgi:hypothetical protein